MFPFSSLSILKAVELKSLFSRVDAFVSLGTVSGDLFCSFEWAVFSCLLYVFYFLVKFLIFHGHL